MANLFATLLKHLDVKHSKTFTNKCFEEHPYKYTLWGMSDLLSRYQVNHIAYSLKDKDELHSLKPPFIAQVSNEFILVTDVSKDKVKYLWREKGVDLDVKKFKDIWSGVVLLVEKQEQSIEPGYRGHIFKERFVKFEITVVFAIIVIVIFVAFFHSAQFNFWQRVVLLVINSAGLFVSFMLLLKQMNIQSKSADKICAIFKKGDCNDILETSAAKFMGIVGWSEVGLSYFLGNIIVIIALPALLNYLVLINVLILPYTFWSVWYQGFRAKQWCPLCLIIQLLLWLIFVTAYIGGLWSLPNFLMNDIIIVLAVFTVPLLLINLMLPKFTDARKVTDLTQRLASLKMKDEVLSVLLAAQPYYEVTKETSNIIFGSRNSKVCVTILTNPHCNPCANMHKKVGSMLDAFGDKICVQYIFTSFNDDLDSSCEHLIALYLNHSDDIVFVRNSYDDWFTRGKFDRDSFFKLYGENICDSNVKTEYSKHKEWISINRLYATPTILVNGYELPDYYTVEDLRYFVDMDFANLINPT